MRKLSVKQKNALRELKNANGIVILEDLLTIGILNAEEINRIYKMNPHETFFQNAYRYLYDLEAERA